MKKLHERIKKEMQFIIGRPESFIAMAAAMLITSALAVMALFSVATGYTQGVIKNREATRAVIMVMNLVMWVIITAYVAMFFTGVWCMLYARLNDSAQWKKGYMILAAVAFVRVAAVSVWRMYGTRGALSRGALTVNVEKLLSAALVLKGGYYV